MFQRILLPVDLEPTRLSARALEIAVEQVTLGGGELYAVTVVPGFSMPIVASYFPKEGMRDATREVRGRLQALIEDQLPDGVSCTALVLEGHPAEMIVKQAKKLGADLIVMPSASGKLERRLIGSCAARVSELATCPVLIVKGDTL